MSTIRRVALVSPYALDVFGGVQEQALGMSRELGRRGVDVLLISPDGGEPISSTSAECLRIGRRVSLPANGSQAPITLSLLASARVVRQVATFKPDVVHLHEPFAPVLSYGLLRARRWPTIGTFHRSGGGPAYALTRPLLRALRPGLSDAVAVSTSAAETIYDALGLRTDVLFNGFELERFAREPQRATEVHVVFVGRLEERKGASSVVDAVAHHNRVSPDPWHLDVVGDGPLRSVLEARATGDRRIVFHGSLADDAKRTLVANAHVAVAASLFGESFGMTILEAMASRTPVVASDIDGYRQASGGHAEAFAPGDAASLEGAIERALRHSDAHTSAAFAHARAWSMQALMDQYLDRYKRLVSRTSHR